MHDNAMTNYPSQQTFMSTLFTAQKKLRYYANG